MSWQHRTQGWSAEVAPPEKLQDKQPQVVRQPRQRMWPSHLVYPQLHDEDGEHARTLLCAAPRVHRWVPEATAQQTHVRVQRDALPCQHGAASKHLAGCDLERQRVGHEHASDARAAGKGVVTDGGEGVGQVQRGEACAPVKGVVADGGEGVGQVQRGEACAPVKGAVADGGEGVGQVQRGEACAPGKGAVADGGEGVGQVQRGEACAPVKGAVTDGGEGVGQVQRGEACAPVKGAVPMEVRVSGRSSVARLVHP